MHRTEKCPYCSADCEADWVDVGVGHIQCAPFHCEDCGASEIGAYDKPRELSEIEEKHGWYAPNSEFGSSANVVEGKIVSHQVALDAYKSHFTNNPLWHDKEYVEKWKDYIRK